MGNGRRSGRPREPDGAAILAYGGSQGDAEPLRAILNHAATRLLNSLDAALARLTEETIDDVRRAADQLMRATARAKIGVRDIGAPASSVRSRSKVQSSYARTKIKAGEKAILDKGKAASRGKRPRST